MFSPYKSQYFVRQPIRRLSSEDEDKMTGAIMAAQIDLNPHQVDAAHTGAVATSELTPEDGMHIWRDLRSDENGNWGRSRQPDEEAVDAAA